MNGPATQSHDYRFLMGLAMGSAIGAGLALWMAPKAAAEIKARAVDSAKSLGNAASSHYRDAKVGVTDAVDRLTRTGQGVRDEVFDTVVKGAQDVEYGAQKVQRFATDAKTQKAV